MKWNENDRKLVSVPQGHMPALGLGTWALRGEECSRAVRAALETGYRHIDTAEMYGNEEAVGDGIRRAEVGRDSVFLVTKAWQNHLDGPGLKRALRVSLDKLGTDYVDLYLVHWPNRSVPMEETFGAMAELKEGGKVEHVGVSNFTVALLEEAMDSSPVPIFCNQVEYHPYLAQQPVLECCREHGVALVGYCPLARGRVFKDGTLREIGRRHGKSGGQVVLRWLIQQEGVGAIPRSSSPEHIRENYEVWDFELSDEEMQRIFDLERGYRIVSSGGVPTPSWDT